MALEEYRRSRSCMFVVHPYPDAWWLVRDAHDDQLKVRVKCVTNKTLYFTLERPDGGPWTGQHLLDAIHAFEQIDYNKMVLVCDGNTVFYDTPLHPGPIDSAPFHLHIASRRFSQEAAARAAAMTPASADPIAVQPEPSSPASPSAIAFDVGRNMVFTIPARDDPCPGPVSPTAAAAAAACAATSADCQPAHKDGPKPKRKVAATGHTCIARVPSPVTKRNKVIKAKKVKKVKLVKKADNKETKNNVTDLCKGTLVSVKWVYGAGFKWYDGKVQYILQHNDASVVGVKYPGSRKVHDLAIEAFSNTDCVRIIE